MYILNNLHANVRCSILVWGELGRLGSNEG